jgi:hypothetical protein
LKNIDLQLIFVENAKMSKINSTYYSTVRKMVNPHECHDMKTITVRCRKKFTQFVGAKAISRCGPISEHLFTKIYAAMLIGKREYTKRTSLIEARPRVRSARNIIPRTGAS